MPTETFLATVLPYSVSTTAPFHVSVFFSHRLTPDAAIGTLDEFPVTSRWLNRLRAPGTTFRLVGDGGELPISPLLAALDVRLWRRVFPPDTPVRPWATPDLTDRPWRTYAAHRTPDHAKLVHAAAAFGSPTSLPSPATDPVSQAMGRLMDLSPRLDVSGLLDRTNTGEFDGWLTNRLDAIVDHGSVELPTFDNDPVMAMLADVHTARRYYQRPEDEQPYRERPVEGAERPPLPRPERDFHQRAGAVGDTPAALRMLGLVVDLRVDDPGLLAAQHWLQAVVTVDGLPGPTGAQPLTLCTVSGDALVTVARTEDWRAGMLRLGDEDRFRVLDLDPDASALKLESHLRSLPRLAVSERNGDKASAAPATLLATGFTVARVDRSRRLQEHVDAEAALERNLAAGGAARLHTEDVTRGVRLEVWDDESDRWHSLHRRLVDLSIGRAAPFATDVPDVGFLQGAALSKTPEEDGGPAHPYYAHEVLAGWDGWSLSAPRPGLVVDDAGVPQPEPVLDPVTRLVVRSKIGPAALPWLRYGRSYAFRAYAVDLAGNSRPHPLGSAPPDIGDGPELVAAWRAGLVRAEHPVAPTLRGLLRAAPPPTAATALAGGVDLAGLAFTGVPDLDRLVAQRLAHRVVGPVVVATRQQRVEAMFRSVAETDVALTVPTDETVPPAVHARALAAMAVVVDDLVLPSVFPALEVVTAPRPFLRWDPCWRQRSYRDTRTRRASHCFGSSSAAVSTSTRPAARSPSCRRTTTSRPWARRTRR